MLRPLLRGLSAIVPKRLFSTLRGVINLCRYDFHAPLITRDHRPKWIGDGYAGTCKYCGRTIFTMTAAQKRQWRHSGDGDVLQR